MIPSFSFLGKTFAIYPAFGADRIFVSEFTPAELQKRRYDDNDMIVFLLISGIGVLLGMHLLYGVTNLPLLQKLLPAGYLYGKNRKLDLSAWSDMIAPVVPLFHVFGRIGCFLGGCCYGAESPVGFVYRYSPIPDANGVVRFPIQLVEAFWNLLLFLVLSHLLRKNRFSGRLFCGYLLAYAPARFLLEFWRGDTLRGSWLGLSTSQWVSLLVIAGALLVLFRQTARQSVHSPAAAESVGTETPTPSSAKRPE